MGIDNGYKNFEGKDKEPVIPFIKEKTELDKISGDKESEPEKPAKDKLKTPEQPE
jgi:hypothetical protein